jgi:lysine-specific histone demethylase 1
MVTSSVDIHYIENLQIDLLYVAGVGRAVKEKVCVPTSRDTCAVAGQLVKLWIEVFRKEKATRGLIEPAKKPASSSPNAAVGTAKASSKDTQKTPTIGASNTWPSTHSASPSSDSLSVGQSKVRLP